MKKTNEKIIEKKFRLQTKELFLTYPQSGDLTLDFVRESLDNILNTFILKEYLISKEFHEDGQPHIHVYCKTFKITSITNQNYFDIEFEGKTYHPNIQSARSAGNVIKYILKFVRSKFDENLLFSKGLEFRIDANAEFMPLAVSCMALAEAGRIADALELYRIERPEFYLKNYSSLEKNLRGLFLRKNGAVAKFDFNKYVLPSGLLEKLKLANETEKSVVLIGSPGTGKSKFIESYVINMLGKTPLLINDFNSIRNFKEGVHDAIIIDDINLKGLDRETIIKLLESESEATFRVTHGSVTIPSGTPRFLISNKNLEELISFDLDEAVSRRIIVLETKDLKLFQL